MLRSRDSEHFWITPHSQSTHEYSESSRIDLPRFSLAALCTEFNGYLFFNVLDKPPAPALPGIAMRKGEGMWTRTAEFNNTDSKLCQEV